MTHHMDLSNHEAFQRFWTDHNMYRIGLMSKSQLRDKWREGLYSGVPDSLAAEMMKDEAHD